MPARVGRFTRGITPVRLRVALLCAVLTALAGLAACSSQRAADRTATAPRSLGATPATSTAAPKTTTRATLSKSASSSTPAKPAVTTRAGMWWGVDSSGPITEAALDNVRGWYRGATPQFWGRYVSGHYAVNARELAFARHKGIYVYLLVNDRNCSQCDGGRDVCGRDRTAGQARADALAAIRSAETVGVPAHTVLFKDIEQVSGCRGEPSASYLDTWYRTLRDTHFRTGFYGNAHQQSFDFPRAYCAAAALNSDFADNVALDMNENEPQLGAPRGSVGPRNAPKFAPLKPDCAPAKAVQLWQYGESVSPDNHTDIDQARPDIKGLLAPDGGVT